MISIQWRGKEVWGTFNEKVGWVVASFPYLSVQSEIIADVEEKVYI